MKYGHTEAHVAGANPNTWRWKLRQMAWEQPDILIVVGAGVVLLICTVAVIFWLVENERRRPPPPA